MSDRARTAPGTVAGPEHPAVGIVATGTNGDAVARAVLRAQTTGYDAIVAELDESGSGAELARGVGVETLTVDAEEHSMVAAREALAAVAEQQSYSGLIFAGTAEEWVDFDRSEDDLDDSTFVVEATRVEDLTTTGTMAAIPAYNEAGTIAEVVRAVSPHADETVVIDDGSADDTADRARDAGATVVTHECNRGYGAALQTVFQTADEAGASRLVILDGDGQHDPDDIPQLVEAQREQDAEVVIGSRFADRAETDLPLYRRLGLSVVNVLTNLSMGAVRPSSAIRDTQCGFRAYSREAIQSLATDRSVGDHMGASTDILHHARTQGYTIVEVPTSVTYDVDDASTRNPVRHGVTLIMNLVRTIERDRPISAVGVPGFVSTLLGVGFGYWTFANYITSGVFPLGLASMSSFFGLAGVFACFTAIILHSLNTQLPDHD